MRCTSLYRFTRPTTTDSCQNCLHTGQVFLLAVRMESTEELWTTVKTTQHGCDGVSKLRNDVVISIVKSRVIFAASAMQASRATSHRQTASEPIATFTVRCAQVLSRNVKQLGDGLCTISARSCVKGTPWHVLHRHHEKLHKKGFREMVRWKGKSVVTTPQPWHRSRL